MEMFLFQGGISRGCEKEFSIKMTTSPKAPLPSFKMKLLLSDCLDSGGVLTGQMHILKAENIYASH